MKLHNINERVKRFGSVSKLAVDMAYHKYVRKATPSQLGKLAKEKFSSMGPTFIKIGQFLSTRSDVFGSDFTNELKGLQDNIDPFVVCLKEDVQVAPQLILEKEPIATASIGQVYKGTLEGKPVAVKIKRPDIADIIQIDFDAFLFVVEVANAINAQREAQEISIVVNEYYKLLKEEIDFKKEVSNMMLFKRLFKPKKFVKVPTVYEEYCNDSVIVMEYVPAVRIDDIAAMNAMGFNRKKIAEKLMEVFLDQILNFGIIHIDPHPGNVGITKDGQIVFYDYGMVQNIEIDFKKDLKNILLAVYEKNVEYLCDIFVKSNIVIVEREKLPYLKNFVLVFLSYIDNLDIDEFKRRYIDKVDSTELPFTISSKFLLILRGMSILEGVCKTLDPTFNYRGIIDTYINDSVVDVEYIERKALMDIDSMRLMPDKITQNQIQLEMMEKTMEKMDGKNTPRKMITLFAMLFAFDVVEDLAMKTLLAAATFMILYK